MAHAVCKLCLALLLCALLPLAVSGQSVQGTLLVAVEDSAGGRIVGAGVTVTLEKAAGSRAANTNERGGVGFESFSPRTDPSGGRAGRVGEKTPAERGSR